MTTNSQPQVLRIDSSARPAQSSSRQVTHYLWQQLRQEGAEELAYHDLGASPLPAMSAQDLVAVHGSLEEERESLRQHLALSRQLIGELKRADILVIGAPLYNFGIPAVLKQWIDYIARAGQTFRYTESGPEGLTGIRDAYVVVATGGTPVGSALDHASAHLRTVLEFIGVQNVHIIEAAGSKGAPDEVVRQARAQVDAILAEKQAA